VSRPAATGGRDRSALALAALLAVAGTTHFAIPHFYDAIVPRRLPGSPRAWTLVSGVAELACAVAVARPRTRRLGATAAAILFVAVFPANIQMAMDWRGRPMPERLVAYGRLPLQIPLVIWALRVRGRQMPGVGRLAVRKPGADRRTAP
jgi:uncharacterized membrane protein